MGHETAGREEPLSRSLGELAAAAGELVLGIEGDPGTHVAGLAYDCRYVPPDHLFFCIDPDIDVQRLAAMSVDAGAVAVCVETPTNAPVPEIVVSDARAAMARMAAEFYGHPADGLTLLAVTGTNGKTTTALLLESILRADSRNTGLIGSLWWRFDGEEESSAWTTPEAPVLHWLLHRMRARGVDSVAMEVTSHGTALGRVDGLRFRSSVFTNLSHDHLDFHSDMDAYFDAKRALFAPERTDAAAVNVDDPYGRMLKERAEVPTLGFGTAQDAEVRAEGVRVGPEGSRFAIAMPSGRVEISTRLVGAFNVQNCLAAAAGAFQAGIALDSIASGLSELDQVPGRFERIDLGQSFAVIVDYAHTPHSFETLLRTTRSLLVREGRLICLFGCGGDCDRTKRPIMGALAGRLADVAVITTDNPRFEDPRTIAADVLGGLLAERVGDADTMILDRREAIGHALGMARPGDVVVIAGKGAEQSQYVRGERMPLDDREVARQALRDLGWDGS